MRSRRALLYVPGDDWHKSEKAASLDVDCICLDMEDGVAASKKSVARGTVARALSELDMGRSERLARINAVNSGLEAGDLDAVLESRPDGIVVPKVAEAEQVKWVSGKISEVEQRKGWQPLSVRLLVMIETALGVLNIASIAASDPRLDALIFGAEDLAADIGAQRTLEGTEVFYARSSLVLTAAAFGLQAIDLLDVNYRDLIRLKEEAQEGARLGFAGKQVIHPNQVQTVQDAFTPNDDEIKRALEIAQAARAHQEQGTGAFGLNGRMVDMPVVKAAERVLARARAAGRL